METLIWLTLLYTLLVLLRKYSGGDSVVLDLVSLSLSFSLTPPGISVPSFTSVSRDKSVGTGLTIEIESRSAGNSPNNRDGVQIGVEQA